MSEIVVKANVGSDELVRQRQNAIIAAAIKVFNSKGYHDATVRDIGREAKLTQGTLYNYVRSKEDILYLVCNQAVSAYTEAITKVVDPSDDPMEMLLKVIRATLNVMWDHKENILLVYQETHSLDKKYRKRIQDLGHILTQTYLDILKQDSVRKRLPDINLDVLANILSFLPGIIALRGWEFRGKASRSEVIAGIEMFLVQGIRGLEQLKRR